MKRVRPIPQTHLTPRSHGTGGFLYLLTGRLTVFRDGEELLGALDNEAVFAFEKGLNLIPDFRGSIGIFCQQRHGGIEIAIPGNVRDLLSKLSPDIRIGIGQFFEIGQDQAGGAPVLAD